MNPPVADQPASPRAPPREPWRRRLVNTLLYGRNVDRAVKARARIGLAILIFAIGYSVIATRLVMFAAVPDGHGARRATMAARAARCAFCTGGSSRSRSARASGGGSRRRRRPNTSRAS